MPCGGPHTEISQREYNYVIDLMQKKKKKEILYFSFNNFI